MCMTPTTLTEQEEQAALTGSENAKSLEPHTMIVETPEEEVEVHPFALYRTVLTAQLLTVPSGRNKENR